METQDVDLKELLPPLAEYELSAHLFAKDNMLELSGVEARVGSSMISGELKINTVKDRFKLAADLRSQYLETDDFVTLSERWRTVDESQVGENLKPEVVPESQAGFLTIINRQIDDLSEDYEFDVGVEVEQLYSAGDLLGNARLHIALDEQEISFDPFEIIMPQGSFSAGYHGRLIPDGIEATLNIHAEQLEFGGLVKLIDPDSSASGLLYLDTSIESVAPTWQRLSENLEGHLEILLIPEKISANFLDLWASNLVFALLQAGGGQEKLMNCLAASFNIEDGVMESRNILLDSTDIIVRGMGSINIAENELDLLFTPQAKLEKFFSVATPITVTGPFTDIHLGVDSGGFLVTMFKWYTGLIYVPYKWLSGERFPADGLVTCYNVLDLEVP